MKTETREFLQQLGILLDRGATLRVTNGGFVTPGRAFDDFIPGNEVIRNDRQKPRTSAVQSWASFQRPQWQTGGSWSPSALPSIISSGLKQRYEAEIDEVRKAYPETLVWTDEAGLWLRSHSSILSGLNQEACFLTRISYDGLIARCWGFWIFPGGCEWIGPRHTNFPDGSVCAFEPADRTWVIGDSIVRLLDLYTVWALRHLHLRVFGRWPGPQSVPDPYERILELQNDELCGCQNGSSKRYRDCCQVKDVSRDKISDAVKFQIYHFSGFRQPPKGIVASVLYPSPPTVEEILYHLAPFAA